MTIVTADIVGALAALAQERCAFHSEADFQRDFAQTLGKLHPDIEVRTEYPVPWINPSGQQGSIDLWLRDADGAAAIELKYRTRRVELVVDGERYELKDQHAQDQGCYDFWKDVARTEKLVADGHADGGYVIALTNDQGYWNKGCAGANYAAFRIHEGREVRGTLAWSPQAKAGSIKGREAPIALRGRYVTRWVPYSQPAPGRPGGEFRYLLLDIAEGLRRTRGDSV